MKIDKDTAVTLRFSVTDAAGKVIDKGTEPMVYLHGGYDNIFPKVEEALQGQEAGSRPFPSHSRIRQPVQPCRGRFLTS
jgi:FKBP-type peptidyl-prolyl cis-trans isomerase 2